MSVARRAITIGVLATAPALSAQEPQPPDQATPKICSRGRPLPTCETFWITEVGYSYQWTDDFSERHYVTAEVGWMWNYHEFGAIGVTVRFSRDQDLPVALTPRFRRWLSDSTSIEFAVGFAAGNGPGLGKTIQLTYNAGDRWAVTNHFEVQPTHGDSIDIGWYWGIKLGSEAGLKVTGVAAGVGLLVSFLRLPES